MMTNDGLAAVDNLWVMQMSPSSCTAGTWETLRLQTIPQRCRLPLLTYRTAEGPSRVPHVPARPVVEVYGKGDDLGVSQSVVSM